MSEMELSKIPSFEWFQNKSEELLEKIPPEFFEELNEGVVADASVKMSGHAQNDDLYIMGEYQVHGVLGKQIRLYYGSFAKTLPPDEKIWEKKLWEVIRHEFRHHLETRAKLRDLEIEDVEQIRKYLRQKGKI